MSDKFRPSRKHLLLAVLVIALVGGGAGIYLEFFRTYHFAVVQDHVLYRDGAHSITEFRNALRKVEPATVVSLNDADEIADPDKPQFREEEALLSERKINLVRIPVKLGGWPTSADIKSFIATVSLTRNQPTLVHCAGRASDRDVRGGVADDRGAPEQGPGEGRDIDLRSQPGNGQRYPPVHRCV